MDDPRECAGEACDEHDAPPRVSERSKERTQYEQDSQADQATDNDGHHHVTVALTVGQTADLQQQQHGAVVVASLTKVRRGTSLALVMSQPDIGGGSSQDMCPAWRGD
jgi:hypothetical protein